MRRYLKDKSVLKKCHIYQMLRQFENRPHLSFHTPGHKIGRWDITELSFSDNLSCPRGCLADAEKDIAEILGAHKSFILTDGSTSGILSMLHAARAMGVKSIAVCEASHKSVFNACALLGITPLLYPQKTKEKIPFPYTMYELNGDFSNILKTADALFLTSPDYYGNIADLAQIRDFCDREGKFLFIDGAHGGHLHFDKELYAGKYADMWVDGVHKNLPAFTQGAVVSARNAFFAEKLRQAVDVFRTTSPSYPIMASVEYAVKYPQNTELEQAVLRFEKEQDRIYFGGDWTKLCAVFGESAFEIEKLIEKQGIYAEFCDGNIVMFYLSPATSLRQFTRLKKCLISLFERYPLQREKQTKINAKNDIQRNPAPVISFDIQETEWVDIAQAEGRICTISCGLFPPCTPLIQKGERVTKEKIHLIKQANNVYGLLNDKIQVLKNKNEE